MFFHETRPTATELAPGISASSTRLDISRRYRTLGSGDLRTDPGKFLRDAAGFIGSHTVIRLLEREDHVVGLENFNDCYDPARKRANLADVGCVAQEVGTLTFVSARSPGIPLY